MKVFKQQESDFNFDPSQIDEREGCYSTSVIEADKTLALSRTATSHRHHFPIKEFSIQSFPNSKRRNPLVQKLLTNSSSLNSDANTLGYSKWMETQTTHKSIVNKTQQIKVKKDKKIDQLKQQIDNKVMSECTFKPQTNKSKTKRNLNEFLQSQSQHTRRVEQKRENLKKNLEKKHKESEPFRPVINKTRIKNSQTPVYDRLYQLKEKDNDSCVSDVSSVMNLASKPQINKKSQNMVRNIPVGQLLYQDAMRRNNTQKSTQIAKVRHSQQRKSPSSNKNNKFVAQKFIKEYYYCLQDLNFEQWKQEYNEQMFQDILRKLGFLSCNSFQKAFGQACDNVTKSQQYKIVEQAFQILKQFRVDARNVCVFLMAIIGIYNINPVNFQRAKQSFQQDQFNLDDIKGRKLQKYFIRLFHNRLSSQALKKTNYKDQNIYQPTINSESCQMAQKHREKILYLANQVMNENDIKLVLPQDGSISHTDLLVIHKLAKQMELEKKRQQKNQLTDPQCTFKPSNQRSQNNTLRYKNQNSNAGVKKSDELYTQTRNKNLQTDQNSQMNYKMARTTQTRFSNNPSLKQKGNKNPGDKFKAKNKSTTQNAVKTNNQSIQSDLFDVRDVDKTLIRMYEARKKRQQEKNFLERGYENLAMNNAVKNTNLKIKANAQSTGQTSSNSSAFKNTQRVNENNFKQFKTPQFDQSNLKQEVQDLIDHRSSLSNQLVHTFSKRIEDIQKQHEESNQKIERLQESQKIPKVSRDVTEEMDFDEEPLLVIDVNMDEQKQQIYIFKGDQQRLQQLVQQFCHKHGLDNDSRQQLMEMVSCEVEQVLRSINA